MEAKLTLAETTFDRTRLEVNFTFDKVNIISKTMDSWLQMNSTINSCPNFGHSHRDRGVLVLRKVSWSSQDNHDDISSMHTSARFSARSRTRSIFDIFWEQANSKLSVYPDTSPRIPASQDRVHGCNGASPWGIPLGCYDVYM